MPGRNQPTCHSPIIRRSLTSFRRPNFDLHAVAVPYAAPSKFQRCFSDVLRTILYYRQQIEALKNLQLKEITCVNNADQQMFLRDIDHMGNSLHSMQKQIKECIGNLRGVCDQSDPDQVMQVNNMNRNFRDAIKELLRAQEDYKRDLRYQAIDQYHITNPSASNAEAREFVENFGAKQVFSVSLNQGAEKYTLAYQNLSDRYQEMLKVEKSAVELSRLASSLHDLAVTQDPKFDSIIENVNRSKTEVEMADINVLEATGRAKKGRKWNKVLFVVSLIAVLFISSILMVVLIRLRFI